MHTLNGMLGENEDFEKAIILGTHLISIGEEFVTIHEFFALRNFLSQKVLEKTTIGFSIDQLYEHYGRSYLQLPSPGLSSEPHENVP